jgi:hypothetical protein
MTCGRRSLTVSILAWVWASGAPRAEQDRRPAGRATQKGGDAPGKGSKPAAPPTMPASGKAGQPKQQYNPKELGVDKSVPW